MPTHAFCGILVDQSVLLPVRALPRPVLHKRKTWSEYNRVVMASRTKVALLLKMEVCFEE